MARYQAIDIVPREIFVIGHAAAMVWTINRVTDEALCRSTVLTCFNWTMQVSSAASVRSGSAARFPVSSSALPTGKPMNGPSHSAQPTKLINLRTGLLPVSPDHAQMPRNMTMHPTGNSRLRRVLPAGDRRR